MESLFAKCPCLRQPEEDVTVLDYRHSSLEHVPAEVFNFERTLEELFVDANQIKDLPRELFYCHGLRKLNLSDNELTYIPPAISSLVNLEEIDISKNGIVDLPENIKCCKYLRSIEASVNPLGKLPEGFTQLLNLSELYLNDTFLDYLPGSFGRLNKLKILEVRENHLKTLPKSIARLTQLERLDIGNNEFTELPDVVGSLVAILELWCDCNQISALPPELGQLKQLMFFDASKNRIETIPPEIEGCVSLADLHLSTNLLIQLPESLGRLSNLTTLKLDDNRLTSLPVSIGGLVSLSELNVGANDLEELPPSIGLLRHLRTLYADENFLLDIPPELGSCSGITVLSVRSNNLTYIPDEIGRIPRLRVLNVSDNKIRNLPFSLTRLRELQALWLAENQTKPLIRLQTEIDIETGQRMLTCYLLPQQPSDDREDIYSDGDSFHPSLWEEERTRKQRIQFDFGSTNDEEGKLERLPTPYPKEMKQRMQHMRNVALKQVDKPNLPNGDVTRNQSEETAIKQYEAEPPGARGVSNEDVPPNTASHQGAPHVHFKEAKVSKPTSPLLQERHVLLIKDKEKIAKDKARMQLNRLSSDQLDQIPGSPRSKHKVKDPSLEVHNKSARDTEVKKDTVDNGFPAGHEAPPGGQKPNQKETVNKGTNVTNSMPTSATFPPVRTVASGLSYQDFMKGLAENQKVKTPTSEAWRDVGYRTFSSHSHRHSHHPHQRGRGYESDTGYRSETGYMSDAGYRSDTQGYRRPRSTYALRDGYASDWEATVNRGLSNRYIRKGGYTSDDDGRTPRSSRHSGNVSDMEVQVGRSRQNQIPFHPHQHQHQHQHHHHSNVQQQQQQQQQPRTTVRSSSQSRSPNTGQAKHGQQMYTNMPLSARNTIRNDELYEQHYSDNTQSKQKTGQPSPRMPTPSRMRPPNLRSNSEPASNSKNSDRSSILSGVSSHEPVQPHNLNRPVSASQSLHPPISKENSGSNEDDQWRAQLYQASVKLQKSPSDAKKMQQWHSFPSLPRAPSLRRAVTLDELSEDNKIKDETLPPPPPPPYQAAPSYTTHHTRTPLRASKSDLHLKMPSASADRHSHRTVRSRSIEYDPQRTSPQSSEQQNNRPISLSIRPNGESPGPPRDSSNPSPTPNTRTPSHTREPAFKRDDHPNHFPHPEPPYGSKPVTPVKSALSRSREDVLNEDRSTPRERGRNYSGLYATDNRTARTVSPHNRQYIPPQQHVHGSMTPKDKMPSDMTTRGHPEIAHGTQGPSYDTPLRLTQYEKDVAVFKQMEPPSQVSSSTDSGYGHHHLYERGNADTSRQYQGNQPITPHSSHSLNLQKTPYRQSPSQDTAREGFGTTPGRNQDSQENSDRQPRHSGSYGYGKIAVFRVTISKNPGLGFSIAGGIGSTGNPYRQQDIGIFITKVQSDGPAGAMLRPGDKILEVNGIDYTRVEHNKAVEMLKNSGLTVSLVIERITG